MGWNGGNTYGVRVDSARVSDSTSGTASSIAGFNNPTTAATANTIVYRDSAGDIAAREIVLSSALQSITPTVLVGMYPTTNQLVRMTPAAVAAAIQTGASGTWGINITGSASSAGAVDYANLTNKGGGTGTYTTSGDYRAPIFYDSNNTGYYVDPASVSYLYGLTLAGGSYFRPNNWIQMDGNYGIYWPNTGFSGAPHLYSNTGSNYTQFRIDGYKNSYGGIYDSYSAVNGIMYDGSGNGGVYREANGRWYFYYNLSNDCMGIGTSGTSSTYSLYLNKGVYAQSRIDATIFYDTNNTGYYADPASTSNFNQINMQGILRRNTSAAGYLEGNLRIIYGR